MVPLDGRSCSVKSSAKANTRQRRDSSQFDINRMINKFKDVFEDIVSDQKLAPHSTVIETDFEKDKYEDKIESHIPGMNSYGTFENLTEKEQCQHVTRWLEDCLRVVREHRLQCELLIPQGLASKIAQDIMRMSHSEPCGLRGCHLHIQFQDKCSCKTVGEFPYSQSTVATFELYLTLKEDTRGICTVKKLIMSVSGCFKNSKWQFPPKMLCAGFQLEKKKLYRIAC